MYLEIAWFVRGTWCVGVVGEGRISWSINQSPWPVLKTRLRSVDLRAIIVGLLEINKRTSECVREALLLVLHRRPSSSRLADDIWLGVHYRGVFPSKFPRRWLYHLVRSLPVERAKGDGTPTPIGALDLIVVTLLSQIFCKPYDGSPLFLVRSISIIARQNQNLIFWFIDLVSHISIVPIICFNGYAAERQ